MSADLRTPLKQLGGSEDNEETPSKQHLHHSKDRARAPSSKGDNAKQRRGLSMPLTVQGFLVVSLVAVVLSISLLFKFFAVVAVDKFGTYFMSSVGKGVGLGMANLYSDMELAAVIAGDNSTQVVESTLTFLRTTNIVEPESPATGAPSRRQERVKRMLETGEGEAALFLARVQAAQQLVQWSVSSIAMVSKRGNVAGCVASTRSCYAYQILCRSSGTEHPNATAAPSTQNNRHNHCESTEVMETGDIPKEGLPIYHEVDEPNPSDSNVTWKYRERSEFSRIGALRVLQAQRRFTFHPNSSSLPENERAAPLEAIVVVNETRDELRVRLQESHKGSEGITITLMEGDQVLVTSAEKQPTEAFDEEVSASPPGTDWGWYAAISAGESIVSKLTKGTFVVVAVAISIGTAVCIFGVLILRIVLTSLSGLKDDLGRASQLKFEGLRPRTTFIREINDMCRSFTLMAQRLESYKPYLHELDASLLHSPSASDLEALVGGRAPSISSSGAGAQGVEGGSRSPLNDSVRSSTFGGARHLVKLYVRYVSRRTGVEKQMAVLEHAYYDGDTELFDHFVDACKTGVKCHRFEEVSVFCQSRDVVVQVRNNRQLEQLISTCPGELHVHIKKSSVRKVLSPLSLLADLVNLGLNIALICLVFFDPDTTKAQHLSISVFCGVYFMTVFFNVFISLWILKWSQRFHLMTEWLGQASMEVSILLLLCSLNTQHIHFLWSQWSMFGFKFNAPRHMPIWKMCVRWSMFGFFFSDLMQILYKTFRLFNEDVNRDTHSTLTGLALTTSILTVAMHLPKKLQLFAIARTKDEDDIDDDLEMGGGRLRTGQFQSLQSADVTLVLFRLPCVEHRPAKRAAIECSAFFSTVLSSVKGNDGTILFFHGTDVLALFNAPRPTPNHCQKGVRCALASIKAMNALHLHIYVALTTDDMIVGNLGSQTRKNFQCFGPMDVLSRMVTFGELVDAQLLATKRTSSLLDAGSCRWKLLQMPTAEDGGVLDIRDRLAPRRQDPPSTWAKILAPFGINAFEEPAVREIGEYCKRWLDGEPFLAEDNDDNQAETRSDDEEEGKKTIREEEHTASGAIFKERVASPAQRSEQQRQVVDVEDFEIQRTPHFVLQNIFGKPRRKEKLPDFDL